jgi:hypothetical protein
MQTGNAIVMFIGNPQADEDFRWDTVIQELRHVID